MSYYLDHDSATREYDARVARRNTNAARITHETWCAYPGEVTDDGTRCTWCGAENALNGSDGEATP